MTDDAKAHGAAHRFAISGTIDEVERFSGGHINESWVVTSSSTGGGARWLLQRLNERVFPRPALVMDNLERVSRHLGDVVRRDAVVDAPRRALSLIPTVDERPWLVDGDGGHWRLFPFIERAISRQRPADAGEAYEAARAFGIFQRWMGEYRGPRLHETIPGFHDTPARLAALERAAERDAAGRAALCARELRRVSECRDLAGALVERQRRGELPERVAHNDAKMSNVLLDARTGEGLCVVDLDTVMPGLALSDFGDMARSMSGTADEDEPDAARMTVRADVFAAAARGWLDGAGDVISSAERALLVTAARVITFEQGLRFLTDFLDGDRYYTVSRPAHNLDRARAQFALVDAFTRDERELVRLVR